MALRANVVTLLTWSVLLACGACGGASRSQAKVAEQDPWADYKGTFAAGALPSTKQAAPEAPKAPAPPSDPVEAKIATAPGASAAAAPEPAPAVAAAPKKKKGRPMAKRKK
jgi:hypothetical protein